MLATALTVQRLIEFLGITRALSPGEEATRNPGPARVTGDVFVSRTPDGSVWGQVSQPGKGRVHNQFMSQDPQGGCNVRTDDASFRESDMVAVTGPAAERLRALMNEVATNPPRTPDAHRRATEAWQSFAFRDATGQVWVGSRVGALVPVDGNLPHAIRATDTTGTQWQAIQELRAREGVGRRVAPARDPGNVDLVARARDKVDGLQHGRPEGLRRVTPLGKLRCRVGRLIDQLPDTDLTEFFEGASDFMVAEIVLRLIAVGGSVELADIRVLTDLLHLDWNELSNVGDGTLVESAGLSNLLRSLDFGDIAFGSEAQGVLKSRLVEGLLLLLDSWHQRV
jgi:hypothetical protein